MVSEGKGRLFKAVLLFYTLVLLLSNSSLVFAQQYLGGNEDCWSVYVHNPINVLVAYDEEVASHWYSWFDSYAPIAGKTYVEWQTKRALYRFPWTMQIAAFTQWDSDDSSYLSAGIYEVERELNWQRGMLWNGIHVDILLAWTGQNIDPNCGGVTHIGYGSALVITQADFADDNGAKHELTHIFGVVDHCQDGDCVLSVKEQFWYWVWEDLTPIEYRSLLIPIWNWQIVGYISPHWCVYHKFLLDNSHGIVAGASLMNGESVLHKDSKANATNPPPMDKLNPPTIWTYLIPVLLFVVTPIVIILAITKVIRRYRKGQRVQVKPATRENVGNFRNEKTDKGYRNT